MSRRFLKCVVHAVWLFGALGGCQREESPGSPSADAPEQGESTEKAAPAPTLTLSPAEVAEFERMSKLLDREAATFPKEELEKRGSAKLFTQMALTSPDPIVVAAGLDGMVRGKPHEQAHLQTPYEVFAHVAGKHLLSTDERVVARAIVVAAAALKTKKPSEDLVRQIFEFSERAKDGPVAYEALGLLRRVPRKQHGEELARALVRYLDAESPYVLAESLSGVAARVKQVQDPQAVRVRAFELAKHPNAVVQGRALTLLAAVAPLEVESGELIEKALVSKEPYVRASACRAFARLRRRGAIHLMVPLLDDAASTEVVLEGWTRPSGEPGRVEIAIGARKRVDAAAVSSIGQLSRTKLGFKPLKDDATWEQHLAENVEAVKAWYGQNKDRLPANIDPPEAPTAEGVDDKAQSAPGVDEPKNAVDKAVKANGAAR